MTGEALSLLGRYRQAVASYTLSLRHNPKAPETLSGRAVAHAAMGRIASTVDPYATPATEEDPVLGTRGVVFAGAEHETPVLLRERLASEIRHDGPVVIEEPSSTTVVPPQHTLTVDELGNLLITATNGRA